MANRKLTKTQEGAHATLLAAQVDVLSAEVHLLRAMGWIAVTPETPGGEVRWRDYVRPPLKEGAPPMLVKQSVALKRELERNFKK